MSRNLRIGLIVIVVVVGAAALVLAGFGLGRGVWGVQAGWPAMMAGGPAFEGQFGYGPGVKGAGAYGPGLMGGGMMGAGAYGPGLMGGGMMGSGAYGPGLMGGGRPGATGLFGVEPLPLERAQSALEEYLSSLGNADLVLGEIMIFDNHAYAQIVERSTGVGALEVLVDPVTLGVYPEHGPNMMWNLKYSPMSGTGMMGWFAGGARLPYREGAAEMPVTAEQAVEAAQQYLDQFLPGTQADEHADPFYGYYTLHVLRDGDTAGMLSVNGYSAQVFLHTWHGDFVEMSGE